MGTEPPVGLHTPQNKNKIIRDKPFHENLTSDDFVYPVLLFNWSQTLKLFGFPIFRY